MKIDYEFTVGVPVDQAWGRMLDLEKIAPCLPGAAIHEETADGEYAGTITVEIGPITVGYKGTVMFEEHDLTAMDDAELRQAEIDQQDLKKQRRAAKEVDIGEGYPRQDRIFRHARIGDRDGEQPTEHHGDGDQHHRAAL